MAGVRLGELEFAIMDYIWKKGKPVAVPDVQQHLLKTRDLAYTTTMTVVGRLHEKGLLHRSAERRPYTYWPAVSREDYSAGLMLGILTELGDRKAVLARFVERIGAADAKLLEQLASKIRSKRR